MSLKKIRLLTFTLVAVASILLVSCGQKEIELPFSAVDVKDINMYQYIIPAEAKKKVITAKEDIESIFQTFDTIKVKANKLENVAGTTTTSFQFNLKDGTDFTMIYINHSTNSGEIKSSYAFDYETTANIEKLWSNYNYNISTAAELELPTYDR